MLILLFVFRYEDTLRPVFAMFTAEMLKTEEENRGESKPSSEDVIGFKKSPVMSIMLHTFQSFTENRFETPH